MNRKVFRGRGQTGFSLIDALIAAVVLGVGLLALAALQASVTRNAADSRARSQIMAFVEQIVERQRAYGVSGNFAEVPLDTLWTTDEVTAAQNAAGVNNLKLKMSPTHYDGRSGAFVLTTATLPASAPQYKILRSVATWTDASGQARRLDLASVLSPRVISSSRLPYIVATGGSGSTAARPVVRTASPVEAGMIPIALGNGSSTVSTNPKPEVGNDEHVSETRFNVINYAALNNSTNVTLQSKVETTVVGCTCDYGRADASATALRPTYWDGLRYVPPKTAGTPLAGKAVPVVVNKVPSFAQESPLCDVCCRDHHDQAGVSGPKFSPLRTSHDHYSISAAGNYTAVTSGVYQDSCRLIRVDGFWRVASDLSNNYYNLLQANNGANPLKPAWEPADSATLNYQRLVAGNLPGEEYKPGLIDYKIRLRTSDKYNDGVDQGVIDGLEQEFNINAPTYLSFIVKNSTKWLHSRGLYVDHLEAEAIAKIEEIKAKSACKVSDSAMRACLLPYIPFTSINLTELTRWSPDANSKVVISNGRFITALDITEPVRGLARLVGEPTPDSNQDGWGYMFYSNSGLAALRYAAILAENNNALSDKQRFKIGAGGSGGGGGLPSYTIDFGNYGTTINQFVLPTNTIDNPDFIDNVGSECSSGVFPASCTNDVLPKLNVRVRMNNYNIMSLVKGTSSSPLECLPATGAVNLGTLQSNTSYPVSMCQNYEVAKARIIRTGLPDIDALSVIPSSPDNGSSSEYTDMLFASVADTDKIIITMTKQESVSRPTTCTYTTKCKNKGCNKNSLPSDYTVDQFVYTAAKVCD